MTSLKEIRYNAVLESVNDMYRSTSLYYGPKVQSDAPDFAGTAVLADDFQEIKLSDFKNKYVLLFFYPSNFTDLCRSELLAIDDMFDEFEKRNVQVIACSVDSTFSHLNWTGKTREDGGVGELKFLLLSDATKRISCAYGILQDVGISSSGSFIIDKNGQLRYMSVNDVTCGRTIKGILGEIDAIQYVDENKTMCFAKWTQDVGKVCEIDNVITY